MSKKNEDFKNMSYVGEFTYLALDKPRKYNSSQAVYESFERDSGIGEYSISWTLSPEEGRAFEQECKSHFENRKKHNKKIGNFGKVHCIRFNDDGTYLVSAKLKASDHASRPRTPQVVDRALQPMGNLTLETGTKGAVKFSICPQPNPQTNTWGISAYLQKVQIREAVRIKDDPEGVFVNEPSETSSDPFGLPAAEIDKLAKAEHSSHVTETYDDEIPF